MSEEQEFGKWKSIYPAIKNIYYGIDIFSIALLIITIVFIPPFIPFFLAVFVLNLIFFLFFISLNSYYIRPIFISARSTISRATKNIDIIQLKEIIEGTFSRLQITFKFAENKYIEWRLPFKQKRKYDLFYYLLSTNLTLKTMTFPDKNILIQIKDSESEPGKISSKNKELVSRLCLEIDRKLPD